jgi:hypothetical protein
MFDELKVRDILNNYESYLTGISKDGGKVEIFQFTDNATKIKTTKL